MFFRAGSSATRYDLRWDTAKQNFLNLARLEQQLQYDMWEAKIKVSQDTWINPFNEFDFTAKCRGWYWLVVWPLDLPRIILVYVRFPLVPPPLGRNLLGIRLLFHCGKSKERTAKEPLQKHVMLGFANLAMLLCPLRYICNGYLLRLVRLRCPFMFGWWCCANSEIAYIKVEFTGEICFQTIGWNAVFVFCRHTRMTSFDFLCCSTLGLQYLFVCWFTCIGGCQITVFVNILQFTGLSTSTARYFLNMGGCRKIILQC